MSRTGWKPFERASGALLGATRYWANSGRDVDFEGPLVLGQAKERKDISHHALSKLVAYYDHLARLKGKLGVVTHKYPAGRGRKTVKMITMSWEMFDEWFSFRKRTKKEGAIYVPIPKDALRQLERFEEAERLGQLMANPGKIIEARTEPYPTITVPLQRKEGKLCLPKKKRSERRILRNWP